MSNCTVFTKRFMAFIAFLTVTLSVGFVSAEEFYVVDSTGNYGATTPEQYKTNFRASVLTSNAWAPAKLESIWKDAENCKTFVYVHGNLADRNGAINDGMFIRQLLNQIITDKNYKLVVWFWNSSRAGGTMRQDSTNAEIRSKWEAINLANFLQAAPEKAQVRLIGYSFGANTTLGACQLLSGGVFLGRTAKGTAAEIQSLLIAPAVPTYAFVSGWEKSLNCQQLCYLTINSADTGLRWYRFVTPDRQTEAMGRDGIAGIPANQQSKVKSYNVTYQVGATHSLSVYLTAAGIFPAFVGK